MKRFLSLTRLSVLLTLGMVSQGDAQGTSRVTVRSAMFPGAGIHDPLELYLGEGGRSESVVVWGGKFSPEYELPRLEVWRFGYWETETDDAGRRAEIFKELGRVTPPNAERVWLVFFGSQHGEAASLEVQAFGVDDNALKEGGVVVVNLAKVPVGVQINKEKAKVDPMGRKFIDPGTRQGQHYPVKLYYPHNGELRPFVTTNWSHGERRRRLAMVVQSASREAPKLLTVDDIAERAQDSEPSGP